MDDPPEIPFVEREECEYEICLDKENAKILMKWMEDAWLWMERKKEMYDGRNH